MTHTCEQCTKEAAWVNTGKAPVGVVEVYECPDHGKFSVCLTRRSA